VCLGKTTTPKGRTLAGAVVTNERSRTIQWHGLTFRVAARTPLTTPQAYPKKARRNRPMPPALVDLDGLADELSTSKRSLQMFWTELPHIRIPSSEGTDGRGALFSVDDVKEYLVMNHGVNYVGQQVQDEERLEIPSDSSRRRPTSRKQRPVQDKEGSKGVGKRRGKKVAVILRDDDPHNLRYTG